MKVGKTTKTEGADYAVETVTDIVQVIPEIWYSEEEDNKSISHSRNEMDTALATTIVGA